MLPMPAAPIARFVTSGLVTVISSGRHRRRTLSGPNTSSPSVGGHERRETAVIWNHTQKICARPSLLCESSGLLGGRTVGQRGRRLVLSALMASPTPVRAAIVPAGQVTRPAPRPAPVGMVRADCPRGHTGRCNTWSGPLLLSVSISVLPGWSQVGQVDRYLAAGTE